MEKRGQAVMEYVLVTALFLLIFVPTTFIFLTNVSRSSDELSKSKLNKLGNSVLNNAEKVFYQGPPSRITIREDMPRGVKSMFILRDWVTAPPVNQLIFNFSGSGGSELLVLSSRVNINVSFTNRSFSEGRKNIMLLAERSSSGIPFVRIEVE